MSSETPDFPAHYSPMADAELLEAARAYDSLVSPAQDALRAEFARRGMEPPLLVDDAEAEAESTPLVTIRRFRDLSEAIVARSFLESSGITVVLQDENLVRLDWQVSNFIGGIRLQVDPSDEAAATELLNQPTPDAIAFGGADHSNLGATFPQPHCPHCGSTDIAFQGSSRGAAVVALWTIGLPLPPGLKSWLCNVCGTRWEDSEDA